MTYSVEISEINKNYGEITALKNVSINIKKNELFGIIGPDGAGKTTLIRILASLILPDTGKAVVENLDALKDFKKLRTILGYMPGKFSLYQDLTVLENLEFFASVFGTTVTENYDLIKDIYSHIEPFKNRRAGQLSGGMKQKLALSCALIHKPEVLLLDEPTTGVDAVSRKEFWEMLKKLQQKQITIVVSTPYMDEAKLCDRIALIQKGEILSVDTPENITKKFLKKLYGIKSSNKFKLLNYLRNFEHTNSVNIFGQVLHYTDKRNNFNINDFVEYLKNNNFSDIEIKPIIPSIEDCFIDFMSENNSEL